MGAFRACREVSGIVTCRGISELHPEEEKALQTSVESFGSDRDVVAKAAEMSGAEYYGPALGFLRQVGDRVAREIEAAETGVEITEPLCVAKEAAEGAGVTGLYILQAECLDAVAKAGSER